MGLIVRPTKPSTGTTLFADGQVLPASDLNNEAIAIYSEFNGNIDNANIKTNAGIDGSKIADAPSGISAAKLNNDSVTTVKILDLNVTKGKVKLNDLTLAQLDYLIDDITISGVGIAGNQSFVCSPTARAVATYELIGILVKRATVNSGSPAVVQYGFAANDQGTNWVTTLYTNASGSGNMTFIVRNILLKKS